MNMPKYRRTTDVQATWREHGWTLPGEDPKIKEKWQLFKTLNTEVNTEQAFDVYPLSTIGNSYAALRNAN